MKEAAYMMSTEEAHQRVLEYLNCFSGSVSTRGGKSLSRLLTISSSDSPLIPYLADALNTFPDSSRLIREYGAQYADIILPVFRSLQSYRQGNLVESYQAFEKAANSFIQEFRNWESAWALEALYVVANEIRVLAERADEELDANGRNPEKLKAAGSLLVKLFSTLAGKGPKRVGALNVACQLFRIYFKLGTLHLCRSVIRSIETATSFDFEEFPIRDRIIYMYYTGRLEVYNENFAAADHKLSYALTRCDHLEEANEVRMILEYLVPVKLSIGVLPGESLLENYGLTEYSNVVLALKRGDLRLLRHALQEHEDQFLRSGVYLVLEKLELQVYQRLLNKIQSIQKEKDPSRSHQVKLDVIVKAMDMDIDEVECIIYSLIHKNLVKGYVAHKSKVVVLSKQDPFPKLNGEREVLTS